MNIAEEYRKAFEAGYFYGRMDALKGREYDDRTPLDRKKAEEDGEGTKGGDV